MALLVFFLVTLVIGCVPQRHAVQCRQTFQRGLAVGGQVRPGRSGTRQIGVAADRRHDARREHRGQRRHRLEGAVAVPVLVARPVHHRRMLRRQDIAVLAEIGHDRDVPRVPVVAGVGDHGFEFAEVAAERDL